jgi:putative DNA primase/helicase
VREPLVIERLRAHDATWKGPGFNARCPGPSHARGDRNPSLSVRTDHRGNALLHCFANCSTADVVRALGCEMSDLYVNPLGSSKYGKVETRFSIRDVNGVERAIKRRIDQAGKRKQYFLETSHEASPDTRHSGTLNSRTLPLYGSERLKEFPSDAVRVVVEGEQVANALLGVGILALGTVTGASTCPTIDVLSILYGSKVILWPDNDDGGRKHMRDIAALIGSRANVSFVDWLGAPPKGDAKDYVDRLAEEGLTSEEIREAVEAFLATWTKAAPQGPRLALSTLDSFEVEKIRWLWEGRIPRNKLTLIAGDPDLGKSLLTLDIAARVTTGRPLPGDSGENVVQGDVVIFAAEDDNADTIRPRIEAAGGDASRVHVIDARPGKHPGATTWLRLDQHIPLLEAALAQFPEVKVIIIDPITGHLGDIDAHKDADLRPLLIQLAALAQSRNVAILIVAHLNKASDKQAMHRPGGSIALVAVPRAGWLVGVHPKDEARRVVVSIKGNLSGNKKVLGVAWVIVTDDNGQPVIRWDDEPFTMTARELLEAPTGKGTEKLKVACEFLQTELASGKQRSADIDAKAKKAGISLRTLRRAKDELLVRAKQVAGEWWLLPPPPEDPECQDANQSPSGGDDSSDGEPASGLLPSETADDDGARGDASS